MKIPFRGERPKRLRDLLPLSPWEGPPIPRFVVTEWTTMYHTTYVKKLSSIMKRGLIPAELAEDVKEITGLEKGVYLEADPEKAKGWAFMLAPEYLSEEDWEEIMAGKPKEVKFAILEVRVSKGTILTLDPEVIDIGSFEIPSAFVCPETIPPSRIKLVEIISAEVA